jgi:pimeloyl-ACP methyl ester carboxylesterase
LKIDKADFLGFSNGGTTCLQIAIRHGKIVNKLIIASGAYKRDGFIAGFFDGFNGASLKTMPPPLQEAYFKANPGDSEGLQKKFDRDVARMKAFEDIPDEQMKAIAGPTLIINADRDVVTNDHALAMSRMLPHAELAILPGAHGAYLGEICSPTPDSKLPLLVARMIEEFLKQGD